jgi:hypothetical protein
MVPMQLATTFFATFLRVRPTFSISKGPPCLSTCAACATCQFGPDHDLFLHAQATCALLAAPDHNDPGPVDGPHWLRLVIPGKNRGSFQGPQGWP